VYATPTIAGSRGAAPVAACWATLQFFGRSGYQKLAAEIVCVAENLANRLQLEIPGLRLIGRPDLSIVAFNLGSGISIFDVCDALKKIPGRNWHLNLLQLPAACHLTVTAANVSLAKEFFVDDVKAAVAGLEGKVGKSETAAFYGATASAPIDLLEEIAEIYLDTCYQVSK
jgi:sphinganine-1-phosphate aldolase